MAGDLFSALFLYFLLFVLKARFYTHASENSAGIKLAQRILFYPQNRVEGMPSKHLWLAANCTQTTKQAPEIFCPCLPVKLALVNKSFWCWQPDKKVFWNFIVMGSTKIGYLDHAIEFRIKKYIDSRSFVYGRDQSCAPAPELRVQCTYMRQIARLSLFYEMQNSVGTFDRFQNKYKQQLNNKVLQFKFEFESMIWIKENKIPQVIQKNPVAVTVNSSDI